MLKNGHSHNGKQNHRCRGCGRQFVSNPTKKVISDDTRRQIDRLLLEKIPLAGIARVMEVSESWLQGYVNQTYAEVEQQVAVEQKKGRLSSSVTKPGHTSGTKKTSSGFGLR